jgi:CRISPR-associated protein (TIGR03986 family)
MALERGVLIVKRRMNKPPLIQVQVGGKDMNVAEGEVSKSVVERLTELADKEVEFERIKGQPQKVRETGGSFIPTTRDTAVADRKKTQPGRRPDARPIPQQDRAQPREHPSRRAPDFHNPYNFVPAPPRKTGDPELGDHCPVNQDAYLSDHYTGSIHVRMVAETPLLVPDTEQAPQGNGHKTFQLRVDWEGKPLIPASSVRGMLRSAYEAITNSRFGRFSSKQHGDRLAFRMDARAGLRLIPARIQNGAIHLLTGTSRIRDDGSPDGPMCAAWLPRYDRGQVATGAVRYPDRTLPAHGDEVVCWVERIRHSNPGFEFWRVREILRGSDRSRLGPQPSPSPSQARTAPARPTDMRQVYGWVCVTNANIDRKHDERVFFVDGNRAPGPFLVGDAHQRKWRELIENYQSIHAEELSKRRQSPDQYLGRDPGQTAWSRHVYTVADRELKDGTLCYVRLNKDRSDVDALFPVMIARELYEASPLELLDDSLRPAASIDELSPADRVFGWVRTDAEKMLPGKNERVAYRGLLRLGPVRCESSEADSVQTFDPPGVPLAILAAPKPQQGRFYVAASPNGEAQADGCSKAKAGYSADKGLRGRKVYPHQRSLPDGHWKEPTADRTQRAQGSPGHYQEYRRPRKTVSHEQRDDQNRSILGWVKPKARFRFDIHVHNLSAVELGALLWLLELPPDCFFRFGGGKPLGFGSVRLEIEACDLRTGAALHTRYEAWHTVTAPNDPRQAAIDSFMHALTRAYPPAKGVFDEVPFVTAFLVACRGHADNLPIHYPRATETGQPGPPSPDGESFRWFVANERREAQYVLSDLACDKGLPTLQGPAGDNPGGHRGGGPSRGPRR